MPKDGTIAALRLGDAVVEGDEVDVLTEFHREILRQDPDVLFTDGGDAFDLPWLARRATAHRLPTESFYLGRIPSPIAPTRPARSFESYGRILHRDASFLIPGRFHVDRGNSFLYGDAAIDGLVDAARLSRLSLQTVVRQSPGTCFTAMEMAHALAQGVHVPFKKNRPEEFKSGRAARRGRPRRRDLPPAGRASTISSTSSISRACTRTSWCGTTSPPRRSTAPAAPRARSSPRGSATARARAGSGSSRGRSPRSSNGGSRTRPASRTPDLEPEVRERLTRRVKMLKWILVTAFGYQGYRNARFGRIECHEAINAYARALIARLVPAAEAGGYRALHGLVDSLWLTPVDRDARDRPGPVRRADEPRVRPPARLRGPVPMDRLPPGRHPRAGGAEPLLRALRERRVQAPRDRLAAPRHPDGLPAVRGGGARRPREGP